MFGVAKGSLAQFANASQDKLVHKPAGLAFDAAAALPISGLAALQALRDHVKVESGQRVLITGASGGVGSYAVQIAKARGAVVTGTCSAEKVDLVLGLGADAALDYRSQDFVAAGLAPSLHSASYVVIVASGVR